MELEIELELDFGRPRTLGLFKIEVCRDPQVANRNELAINAQVVYLPGLILGGEPQASRRKVPLALMFIP